MLQPISRPVGVFVLTMSLSRLGGGREVRRFEERRRRVDELIFDEIAQRREAPDLEEREDVFSMLLLARDEDGQPMTDQELRDELVTLLVAGHETTATGLAWAFDLLLHDHRVLTKLRAAMEDGDEEGYLDAVVKEALRIRPVIPGIGRVVRGEPFELGGYSIPPGIEINPSIAIVHRAHDRFPHAREFRPERFLEDEPPDTYTWIPFGGGVRRCIGCELRAVRDGRCDPARAGAGRAVGRRAGAGQDPAARDHDGAGRGVPVRQVRPPRPATAAGVGEAQAA